MPRLYRESPLASIWEGSGNVQCLDVLRAMVKSPTSVEAFFAEVMEGAGAEPRLDAYVTALRDEIPGDIETIESRARRVVERMALALQVECILVDYSAGGACLQLQKLIDLPERFEILYGTTRKRCRVVWKRGMRIGVTF